MLSGIIPVSKQLVASNAFHEKLSNNQYLCEVKTWWSYIWSLKKSKENIFAIKPFLTFEKSVLSLSAMLVITYHPHAFEDNVNVRSGRDRRVSNDIK